MYVNLKPVLQALLAAAATALAPAASAGGTHNAFEASALAHQSAATDRMIVKYRDTEGIAQAMANRMSSDRMQQLLSRAAQHGLRLARLRSTATGAHVLKLDRRLTGPEAASLAATLKDNDERIEYAEPDAVLHPMMLPNDPYYAYQWDLSEDTGGIRAPQAWDLSTGSGVVVAVIDTGYRPHPDLATNIVGGYDFIADSSIANDGDGRDADSQDPGDWSAAGECSTGSPASNSSWHGTHVAGTIAAIANNAGGVTGIAFGSKVLPLRALGKCGGYTSDIADAMVWASGGSITGLPANPYPARVVNMSLGGDNACGATMQNAINTARSRNTVVVVAAGNSNTDAAGFSPASCAGVIAVAATDRNGARAYYSNYGSVVALAAPGGDVRSGGANGILSTLNSGTTAPGADNYAYYQGTSMATPHVAAVAALMISKNPALTPDQVASKLQSSARPFPGVCSGCGAGLLDAYAAVQAAASPASPPPIENGTVTETEPNNALSAANVVAAPAIVKGTIGAMTDTDFFAVDLPPGRSLTASLMPPTVGDYDLYIYNPAGSLIARSVLGTGKVDKTSVQNTGSTAARYYVRVVYYSGLLAGYTLDLKW